MKIGLKATLSDDDMRNISGGAGGTTVKAAGDAKRIAGRTDTCPFCNANALTAQLFSPDNGRSVYNGYECTACSTKMIYGENIM